MMDRARIVDSYISKIENKELDLYQVRKELESNNMEEEEIKITIRLIDNEIQRRLIYSSNKSASKEIFTAGLVIFIIWIFITAGTYTGLIQMGNSFLLTYGPILSGISLMIAGKVSRKRK